MLRVTVHVDEKAVTLQMEGRLAGAAVLEVGRCWQTIRREHPGQAIRVDLRAVIFIDQEGIALLKQVFREGAGFLSSGCLTKAYVEEVTRSS